ncbi:MAG: glycosyltransferase family 2 protein [Shinella sp.]|nr:glycosyltransferase family 2 protein [Shinella sp.]
MSLAEYPGGVELATAIGFVDRMPAGRDAAAVLPAGMQEEARLLSAMGFSKPLISRSAARALENGTTLEAELLAGGGINEATYFEALAGMLGIPFLAAIEPDHVQDIPGADTQLAQPRLIRLHLPSRPPVTAIVPSLGTLETFRETLAHNPQMRDAHVATSPSALKAALWHAGRVRRLRETVSRLFDTAPHYSARVTFWGRQGFYAGLILCGSLSLIAVFPFLLTFVLHIPLTVLFLAALAIRMSAFFRLRRPAHAAAQNAPAGPRPVYSVFVALYHEAHMVPQLVRMLDRLEWPRSRLDIKFICEADDVATLHALSRQTLGPEYEVVEVPPALPRTKPKALSYALPAARGEYLVIYDAEDRPHPGQLEEAWRAFSANGKGLACLQAPLVIDNARVSWISALFALEYSALFRGLLPLLAATSMPMPLGGTSNHFRTEILKRCGGWDPYNVTEDADLGMRLFRLGYRCGVLTRPTIEDAPTRIKGWSGQRSRWFKGWLQTWLVMMRQPRRLLGELGLPAFAMFQVLIGGLILSSLAHPLLIAYVIHSAWVMAASGIQSLGPMVLTLFVLDMLNIFGSYAVFIALGRATMAPEERRKVGWRWVLTGFYWLLMSAAAWRAFAELLSDPFAWNKTAHQPSGNPG